MPHALIVDADAGEPDALAELVAAEGFTTATGADLREARAQMGRLRPDVVLIDLKLPDGNGMDLFEEPQLPAGTEMILITDDASVEGAVEALRRGATNYLVKPISLQRLKAVLSAPEKSIAVRVGTSLAEADRKLILATLEHCGGVKKRAAQLLGISLKTLYNRLGEYRASAPAPDQTEKPRLTA